MAVTALAVLLIANFSLGDKKIDRRVESLYSVADPQFQRTMGACSGRRCFRATASRRCSTATRSSRRCSRRSAPRSETITFETYIYWSGEIGNEFADALSERARAGVKVHVLLDWVGSGKIDEAVLEQMKAAGVEVRSTTRCAGTPWRRSTTARTASCSWSTARSASPAASASPTSGRATRRTPDHWRDTHFRVEGPVVAQMQAAFMDNWIETTGEVLHGEDYFPAAGARGTRRARRCSPARREGGGESMQLMYLLSIAAAARSIRLSSAYFVPDDIDVQTLRRRPASAACRCRSSCRASTSTPPSCAARRAPSGASCCAPGVEIYEYQPTMYHCKVMIVDGLWTSVGSTNFDNRSFRLNDEANLNIYDARLRRAPGADLRGRPEAVPAHHPGGMGEPAVDREALGAHARPLELAALGAQIDDF